MRLPHDNDEATTSRLLQALAAGLALVTAAWTLRHLTARSVRAWRPAGGCFVRAGDLTTRVSGSGERAFVLLHGLVTSSDTFGSSYDRLASYARLVVPDLLGFGRSMIFEPRELGKKFDRKV